MKKRGKGIVIALSIALFLGLGITCLCLFLGRKQELPNYHGDSYDEDGKVQFSTDLFYRNDRKADGADPFVLDNTTRDGYYYLYVTESYLRCYRSVDLVTWDPIGNTLATEIYEDEQAELTDGDIWAPEVIYDEETQLYYMYFSATPQSDTNTRMMLYAATSENPEGPYRIVNFMDEESCGEGNLHDYDTEQYQDDFANYLLLDPERFNDFLDAYAGGRTLSNGGTYSCVIDPHPYVDPATGTKYLYFTAANRDNLIIGMEMDNWLKPRWETMTIVICTQYYTVEDWKNDVTSGTDCEDPDSRVNEGPAVVYHDGKYYMTLSVNSYEDSSYSVLQAVGDSPLGPFRKLREEENGRFLSGNTEGSKEVSGTGHHSFVTVGDKLYVIYHRHNSVAVGGGNRNVAVDEVKWVTIKNIYGQDMDVFQSQTIYAKQTSSHLQQLAVHGCLQIHQKVQLPMPYYIHW